MKLSREKMVQLSHLIVKGLEDSEQVSLEQPRNEVRLRIFDLLREEMQREEKVEAEARRKITSQKRKIVEGSREWDVLYRKYYDEETAKLRKVR